MGSSIELTAADGHRLAAWQAAPAGKARGALVVAPEIFGVNSHIRAVADGYAADGYLAIAPALFDRVQRGYQTGYAPDEIQAGIAIMQKIDFDDALRDVAAAIAHGQAAGRVAIVGYCWGGTVAWLAAARLAGLSCAVPYYGGGMPGHMGEQPKCPVLCHFGERDMNIPVDGVRRFAAAHPEIEVLLYAADHGFNCDQRGSHDAAAAKLARERSVAFMREHIG